MMRKRPLHFGADVARQQWDFAAEAFAERQALGGDYYRTEFFGPAHVEQCGDVSGLDVLDIGCGAGYLSRQLANRGARVTGIDLSARMIECARARSEGHEIRYEVVDAAEIHTRFPPASFDLVTACVSLQDMPEPASVLSAVNVVLKAGSRFVFCNTHPCTDTPHRQWAKDDAGQKVALEIAGYFSEGPMEFEWSGSSYGYDFTTTGIHATLSRWITWTVQAGFVIEGVLEPEPSRSALDQHPDLEDATLVPYFIIFDVRKRDDLAYPTRADR